MTTDFANLSALFLNCTLKKTPQQSHTQGLIMRIKGRTIKETDAKGRTLIVYGNDTINSPILSHLRLL